MTSFFNEFVFFDWFCIRENRDRFYGETNYVREYGRFDITVTTRTLIKIKNYEDDNGKFWEFLVFSIYEA